MLQCFRKFAHYKLQITNLKNNIGTYNRKCTSNAYVGPHKNKFWIHYINLIMIL